MWLKEPIQTSKVEPSILVYELHKGKDGTIVIGNSLHVTPGDAVLMIQSGTAKAHDAQIGIIPHYLIGEGDDK